MRKVAPELPRYIDLAQAAEILGVSRNSVRNYIAAGRLPAHRIRGSRLIRVAESDVVALLRPIPAGGDRA